MSCRQAALMSSSDAQARRRARPRHNRSTTEDIEDTEDKSCLIRPEAANKLAWRTRFTLCVLHVLRGEKRLIGNGRDLSRAERLEELARAVEGELRVARLDAQEEPVAARQREARHVEHRVIRLRQPVQRQHPE